MGYARYIVDGRECGYAVEAVCDWEGCDAAIDRGLAYACGDWPGGGEDFCDGYFCAEHLYYGDFKGQRCPECSGVASVVQP